MGQSDLGFRPLIAFLVLESFPSVAPTQDSVHRLLRFGAYEADLRNCELRKFGVKLKLQDQPFQVLSILLERPGDLITREELHQKIWPADTFVDFDDCLNKAVAKLRGALNDDPNNPQFIETVPRRGYRFLYPVQAVSKDAGLPTAKVVATDNTNTSAPALTAVSVPDTTTSSPLMRFRRGRLTVICILSLIVIGAIVVWKRFSAVRPNPVPTSPAITAAKARRSFAVLEFRNLSGRREADWLSTAISQMLNTELASGGQLRAVRAEDVMRVKAETSLPANDSLPKETLGILRNNLGADMVVLGSYTSLGNNSNSQLRIDIRIQDTKNGTTLDSFAVTGTGSKLFDLISDAGARLRSGLDVREISAIEAGEVHSAMPSNPLAVEYYSLGLQRLRTFDALAAKELLQKAANADPAFPLVHSAIASAWSALGYDASALLEARKAFDLSAGLSREDRMWVEAQYRESSKQWTEAEKLYQALFELHPDDLEYGLRLARVQIATGQGKNALATSHLLEQQSPQGNQDVRVDLMQAAANKSIADYKGELEVAERAAHKAEAQGARLLQAEAVLLEASACNILGENSKSLELSEQARQMYESVGYSNGVAQALHNMGNVLRDQGELTKSQKMHEQALAIRRKLGNQKGVAQSLGSIANVYMEQRKLAQAQSFYASSAVIWRKIEDKRGLAITLDNTGIIFSLQGRPAAASVVWQKSLALWREIGDRDGEGFVLLNLGVATYENGNLALAKQQLTEALEIARQLMDKYHIERAEEALAPVLLAEGDFAGTRTAYQEALKLSGELGAEDGVNMNRMHLAELAIEEGQPAGTEAQLRNIAEQFHTEKQTDGEAEAYQALTDTFLAQGKVEEARKALEQAKKIAASTQDSMIPLQFAIRTARIEAASGDVQLAHTILKGVLTKARAKGYLGVELDARSALIEAEVFHGNMKVGCVLLSGLQRDAAKTGFAATHVVSAAAGKCR